MRRTPLRPVGQRGRERQSRMSVAGPAVIDRAEGACEVRCVEWCSGHGEHLHHRWRRSQGGPDEPWNLLLVCRACHDWIHGNPLRAWELGWILRTAGVSVYCNDTPGAPLVTVLRGGGLAWCSGCGGELPERYA